MNLLKLETNPFFKKAALLFVGLLIGTSCSVFDTREAEDPDAGATAFIQPDRSDVVIDNITNAIRDINPQIYLSSLSLEEFEFTPSSRAQINDPSVWSSWGRDQEQTWFNNVVGATENLSGHQLQLSNPLEESLSPTAVQFTANYTLTIIHNRASSGVPTVATGRLVWIIRQAETGLWFLAEWTDISGDNNEFTWSDMKATFIRG